MTLRVTTCHNLSWSVTCYKYDGLLMWPIIMCRHIIIPCENVISSCSMRGLHEPFYEWSQIRDWMKIMKVMRLWDAYHHNLIGLQSANQSPELWSSDHWQIWIVCAHHNQWQDKMIQITSSIEWNCVSFKILKWHKGDPLNAFRIQIPEDFQSSENKWNFELQLTWILFTYNYRTLYFHNWSFSAVNSFSL